MTSHKDTARKRQDRRHLAPLAPWHLAPFSQNYFRFAVNVPSPAAPSDTVPFMESFSTVPE